MKKLAFTVPRSDLRLETFRCGGNGGQNANKRDTGVRIHHDPSGAVGEARDERQQGQNRKLALQRLVASPKFVLWAKLQVAAQDEGFRTMAAKVDASLAQST